MTELTTEAEIIHSISNQCLNDNPPISITIAGYKYYLSQDEFTCKTCNDEGILDTRYQSNPWYAGQAMKKNWAGIWMCCPDCEKGQRHLAFMKGEITAEEWIGDPPEEKDTRIIISPYDKTAFIVNEPDDDEVFRLEDNWGARYDHTDEVG